MALGIGKKSAERLGIKLSDIERVKRLLPSGYYDWQENREAFEKAFPKTSNWIFQCHNFPNEIDLIMEMFNELLDGFGVEAIRDENECDRYYGDIVGLYVNMGDTYNTTVVYDTINDRFITTSWGDFVERMV